MRGSGRGSCWSGSRDTDVALVSDAGVPTVSDPGRSLVAAAAERGFAVVALPGASAVTTALAASGMDAGEFVFIGFLPRRRTKRARRLAELADETRAVVAFESPRRLAAALSDMREALGDDRRVAVCREMTKLHEEVFRGTAAEAAAHFKNPRGEFTLVIEGAADGNGAARESSAADAAALLSDARASGMTARDAVAAVGARTGLSRRELYSMWAGHLTRRRKDARKRGGVLSNRYLLCVESKSLPAARVTSA